VTATNTTIRSTFPPHDDDPGGSLAFYPDTIGFEVRKDVGCGGRPSITIGAADQPGRSIPGLPVRRWARQDTGSM